MYVRTSRLCLHFYTHLCILGHGSSNGYNTFVCIFAFSLCDAMGLQQSWPLAKTVAHLSAELSEESIEGLLDVSVTAAWTCNVLRGYVTPLASFSKLQSFPFTD